MHAMEQINRRTWSKPLSLRGYKTFNGYIETGEKVSFDLGFALAPGRRVLDIGIGGGRTAALLTPRASDYLGVDYTPEMVAISRENHPDRRFEHMDARDMSALADGSFDLVVFSYNGIDSVDPAGRAAVMSEVSRVLAPGGVFVFSTFHRHWKGFEADRVRAHVAWSGNPLRLGLRYVRLAIGTWHARQRRVHEDRTGEHAIRLHAAHDYGIMVYATSAQQINAQLDAAGFSIPPQILDERGEEIKGMASSDVEHFNVVARKAG